jgi:hypothetical protein
LSEDLRARKAIESARTVRNTELKAIVNSQVERIAELEMVYTDLKRERRA